MAKCSNCDHDLGYHGKENCQYRYLALDPSCGCAWHENATPFPPDMQPVRCPACHGGQQDPEAFQCEIMVSEATTHIGDHRGQGLSWPQSDAVYPVFSRATDPCYYGHFAGCAHRVDADRLTPPQKERLALLDDGPKLANSGRIKVQGYDFTVGVTASAGGPAARDSQVGGDHYRKFAIQPWDVIDEYGLSFYAGSVLKYLLRAGRKGPAVEDLKKARHYLDKLIEIEEQGGQ